MKSFIETIKQLSKDPIFPLAVVIFIMFTTSVGTLFYIIINELINKL